jgi:tetratricopeptide (TPR) repeat protein
MSTIALTLLVIVLAVAYNTVPTQVSFEQQRQATSLLSSLTKRLFGRNDMRYEHYLLFALIHVQHDNDESVYLGCFNHWFLVSTTRPDTSQQEASDLEMQAKEAYKRKDYSTALDAYKRAATLHGDGVDALGCYEQAVSCTFALDKHSQAVVFAQLASRVAPKDTTNQTRLGNLWNKVAERSKDQNVVEQAYIHAVEYYQRGMDGRARFTWIKLGHVQGGLGHYKQALVSFEASIASSLDVQESGEEWLLPDKFMGAFMAALALDEHWKGLEKRLLGWKEASFKFHSAPECAFMESWIEATKSGDTDALTQLVDKYKQRKAMQAWMVDVLDNKTSLR